MIIGFIKLYKAMYFWTLIGWTNKNVHWQNIVNFITKFWNLTHAHDDVADAKIVVTRQYQTLVSDSSLQCFQHLSWKYCHKTSIGAKSVTMPNCDTHYHTKLMSLVTSVCNKLSGDNKWGSKVLKNAWTGWICMWWTRIYCWIQSQRQKPEKIDVKVQVKKYICINADSCETGHINIERSEQICCNIPSSSSSHLLITINCFITATLQSSDESINIPSEIFLTYERQLCLSVVWTMIFLQDGKM